MKWHRERVVKGIRFSVSDSDQALVELLLESNVAHYGQQYRKFARIINMLTRDALRYVDYTNEDLRRMIVRCREESALSVLVEKLEQDRSKHELPIMLTIQSGIRAEARLRLMMLIEHLDIVSATQFPYKDIVEKPESHMREGVLLRLVSGVQETNSTTFELILKTGGEEHESDLP